MEFRLLGPLEVEHEGETPAVGGRRQRSVLAALLLRANSVAGIGYLAEAVWEKPPVAPESNIRTYVAGLRRMFGAIGEDRLATRSGGYLLTVHRGELDLEVFEEQAGLGNQAWQRGDFAAAAGHFERAAGLWRGRPLAGLSPGPVLRAEIARLEDVRLTAAERHAHARIELGRPETAVGDLRVLLAEHPLREQLWVTLMLALQHAGRQVEALDAFSLARQHLVTELGVEPGARLRQVHQDILAGESAPPAQAETGAWRQLPMDIGEFVGREAELRTLHALAEPDSPTAVVISAIHGMAGVGKTRLAVHVAHQLVSTGRFDEIQLWADLRGFDAERPPVASTAVLENFLRLLGVAGQHIPQELESRAALYRSRLAGRRALVLLDNAATEDQVRHLLPGGPSSLVLITSRRSLSGLAGARELPVDVLPQQEAVALLARIVGDDRVADEPRAAARVAELCGGLPIAVSLAARRLRMRPTWTVEDLATRLQGTDRRLDQLAPGTHELDALFTMSYRALPPAHQRMFRLLGLHPGSDFTAGPAAALAATTPEEAELQLETLLDEHLLEQTTAGRYRFHDLVRSFARARARNHETRRALHRLLTWYLHAAESARGVFDPRRVRIVPLHPLPAECIVPRFVGHEEALAWYESERTTLRAVVETAAEAGLPEVSWQLAWVMLSFYYRRSHWDDWIATFRVALAATRSLGERRGEGIIWRGLGVAYSDLRQFATAIECHHRAQALLAEAGDRHGQAWNLNNLGVAYVDLGRLAKAAGCFHRALALFRETGDRQGEGLSLNNLGDTYRRLDEPARAAGRLEQALTVQRENDDRTGLQFTLGTLGDIHHDAGRHDQARRRYEEALAISRELGDQRTTARMLANLAQALDAQGHHGQARARRQEAVAILDELGDPHADVVRERLG